LFEGQPNQAKRCPDRKGETATPRTDDSGTSEHGAEPTARRLNLAKSKFSPGPAPKSGTRVYEIAGQSIKLVAKGIDAEGKPMLAQYSAKFDGKDYPYPGWADIDTVSLKRIDANTIEATEKLDGKVALTSKNVISKDGKSMTITIKGTNAKGQTVDNILVYDKR
jgi:hypothetical protein